MDELAIKLTKTIREEIVRQYRDDERRKCPAGTPYYEEEVGPYLIALATLAAIEAEGMVIVPRTEPSPVFNEGDSVVHRLNGEGTVTRVDRDGTWVHFPCEIMTQKPLVGCYDRDWFRINPGMLSAAPTSG